MGVVTHRVIFAQQLLTAGAVAVRRLKMRLSIVLLLLASLQGFVAAQTQCAGELDALGDTPPFFLATRSRPVFYSNSKE